MIVELDRKDIITLVKGSKPNYSVMDKIPSELGCYATGIVEYWKWYDFSEDVQYTEEYLYDLYLMCKNSWK